MKPDRQLVALRGLNVFYYASSAILLPYLPLYLQQKGYSSGDIGLLMMIGPFVSIFAQPFWGYLSDRLHTVKKLILLLWSLSLLASAGLFLTQGFWMTLLFILLLYFFLLPSVPLLDSIMIKSAAQRGRSYGSIRMWGSIGFSSTALISGLLLARLGGIGSIPYIYWTLWIFPLLLLIPLKDEQSDGQRVSLGMIGQLGRNKLFLWFLLLVLLLAIPHRMNDAMLGLYLSHLGASDSMVSWAWALAAVSEIPTFALFGRFMHRFHELALLGVVAVLYVVRWSLYAWIDQPVVLMALQMSHTITFAAFWIVSVQYVVRLMPTELGSTGQALLAMVFMGLAGMIGGTVGGWLNELWGGASMYVFAAGLSLLAACLFFATHIYMRKRIV